jgi:diguanylate cyclase (GGDEF)-like protein/PAS domain S-box-containing protein
MTQSDFDLTKAMPLAKTDLAGFGGAALAVSPNGAVRHANDQGAVLLANLGEDSVREIAEAACRAMTEDSMRLERLNTPFPGDCADAVILPLVDHAGALVVIATNPAESALRRALIESRQRYRDLIDASSDFVWETDRQGRFVFLSAAGALGYTTRDMLGRVATDFLVDASSPDYPVFQARETVLGTDVWLQRADGQISCQSITAVPIYDPEGAWCGTRGMGRDVTLERERERLQKQRVLRDRLMTHLADTIRNEINPEKTLPSALSGTGLAIGADGGMILDGHPAASGYEIVSWGAPLRPADFQAVLTSLAEQGLVDRLSDGLQLLGYVTQDSGATETGMMAPRVNGAILFWRSADGGGFADSDRAILAEVAGQAGLAIARLHNYRAIVTLSNTDDLTGLLNRRAFFADLERRLSRLAVAKGTGALIYLDINNLKAQNDAGGHLAGDRAILACAEILRSCTRPTDLIARIGGDEFLLWLDGVTQDSAARRGEALLSHARRLTQLSIAPDKPLGISLGIAVYDSNAPDAALRLLARADEAMYRAKSRRRSSFELAEPAITATRKAANDLDGESGDFV